ncbi:MAG: hypothetical protein M3O89_07830 [Actinomycetota bacterium]|nr:hypothetical protein [Actinomycetota bacterium]
MSSFKPNPNAERDIKRMVIGNLLPRLKAEVEHVKRTTHITHNESPDGVSQHVYRPKDPLHPLQDDGVGVCEGWQAGSERK